MGSRRGAGSVAASIRQGDGGIFFLEGEFSFSTVPTLLRDGEQLLATHLKTETTVTMDLKGVVRSDSAGIALLVEWARHARSCGGEAVFLNIPAQMAALVCLSGLEAVLSLPRVAAPAA